MKKDKPITIYDIAREAGVSPATVSRVLTGKAKVREDKAAKIQGVIDALNYHPNLMARNLQTQESKTIGVIMPDISNPFFSEYFVEIERYALTKGYTVFLCNTMNNSFRELGDVESVYLQSLLERRVDGIIFMGGRINDKKPSKALIDEMNIINSKVPVVFVNGKMPGVDSYIVKTNERDGIIQMIEYLISLGHRDLAMLGGIKGMIPSDLKYRALKDILKKYNLPVREEWLIPDGFSIESGELMINKILKMEKIPTGLICINDFVAIGALKGALKAGIKVPDELAISGFDDISISAHFVPAISSVSHNYKIFAQKTVDILLNIIAEDKCPRETLLPMELVVRESTGIVLRQ